MLWLLHYRRERKRFPRAVSLDVCLILDKEPVLTFFFFLFLDDESDNDDW